MLFHISAQLDMCYCPDLLFISCLTEQDHPGSSDVQRGSFPALSGGAVGEHHQWRCSNGWLVVHTWWPAWTHRGWVQCRATGPSGLVERVHEQRKFLWKFGAYSTHLTPPHTPFCFTGLHFNSVLSLHFLSMWLLQHHPSNKMLPSNNVFFLFDMLCFIGQT